MKIFKIFLVLAIALGSLSTVLGQSKQTLTVDQIVAMKKAGIAEALIKKLLADESSSATSTEPGFSTTTGSQLTSVTFRVDKLNLLSGASRMIMGKKMKQKATLTGASAQVRVSRNVELLFSGDGSPEEFTLVRLDSKSNQREVVVLKVGSFSGRDVGFDDGKVIKFSSTKIGVRKWKINLVLDAGEYALSNCQFHLDPGAGATMSGKTYTFGVD